MSFTKQYLHEVQAVAAALKQDEMDRLAQEIVGVRKGGGRLFIAGLGGSAANASHATNDFRKLTGINAICLSDNVSELTARANDEGWRMIYEDALQAHRVRDGDALLVLSVGGGTKKVSLPLVRAIDYARSKHMRVLGIVGRDGGYTKQKGHAVVVIPTVEDKRVTPHAESFQSVVLHYLVSHPSLQRRPTKW